MNENHPLNVLTKWRSWFAAWQLGTRSGTDAECAAVKDHREVSILMRAELTALTGLLIEKGVFTVEEFSAALDAEALKLDQDYSGRFAGVYATPIGLTYKLPESAETMRRMNFKP